MHSSLKTLAGATISLALCASPTMAATATPAVSTQMAAAAATSEAAIATQSEYDQDAGITTIGWLMIALDILVAGWGISTLFDDDDDDDSEPVPVSPN